MQEEEDSKPVTKEELAELSKDAIRVFAARCVLRVMPALGYAGNFDYWKEDAAKHMAAVEAAALAGLVRDNSVAARVVAAAADAAAFDARHFAFATTAVRAAAAAAVVVATFDAFDALVAARTAARSAARTVNLINMLEQEILFEQRQDYLRLRESSNAQDIFFIPLWELGIPKYWEAVIAQWGKALESIGLPEVWERYQGFLYGRTDLESAEHAVLAWYERYRKKEAGKEQKNESGSTQAEPVPSSPATDNESASLSLPPTGGTVTASSDEATSIDRLGREPLVNALRGLLDHDEQQGKLVIGLMGHWGVGKSSVIKMLKKALENRDRTRHEFICAEFDAWVYEHCGNIQAGMAQEVVNGLTAGFTAREKLNLVWRLALRQNKWVAYSVMAGLLTAIAIMDVFAIMGEAWRAGMTAGASVGLLTLFWKHIKNVLAHPMAAQLKSYIRLPDFGAYLGLLPVMRQQIMELCDERLGKDDKGKRLEDDSGKPLEKDKPAKRLLFVIDNLDRCGVDGLVKVLEATHIVMGLPRVVVLIAVDHRMALAALTKHYAKLAEEGSSRTAQSIARDYLGKIFQLSIQLDGDVDSIDHYVDNDLFQHVESEKRAASVKPQPPKKDVEQTSATVTAVETISEKSAPIESEEVKTTQPKSDIPKEEDLVRLKPSLPLDPEQERKAMMDMPDEKRRFKELARMLNIHNPRQLKRLHNSYRLMKGIAWHEKGQPEIDETLLKLWLELMAMLFWLEHLYSMDDAQRASEEAIIRNVADEKYNELRHWMSDQTESFMAEYERLKRRVTPLMLPFTDNEKKEVSQQESVRAE